MLAHILFAIFTTYLCTNVLSLYACTSLSPLFSLDGPLASQLWLSQVAPATPGSLNSSPVRWNCPILPPFLHTIIFIFCVFDPSLFSLIFSFDHSQHQRNPPTPHQPHIPPSKSFSPSDSRLSNMTFPLHPLHTPFISFWQPLPYRLLRLPLYPHLHQHHHVPISQFSQNIPILSYQAHYVPERHSALQFPLFLIFSILPPSSSPHPPFLALLASFPFLCIYLPCVSLYTSIHIFPYPAVTLLLFILPTFGFLSQPVLHPPVTLC